MTVAYPSGVAAGRKAVLFASVKLSTATWGTVTGFTLVGQATGGTGASANDAGTTRVGVWERTLDGSESGSVTVTNTGGVSCAGAMSIYTSSLGGWAPITFVTASDTTHGTNPTGDQRHLGIRAGGRRPGGCRVLERHRRRQGRQRHQHDPDGDHVRHRHPPQPDPLSSGTDSGVNSWDAAVTSGGSTNALTTTMTSAVSSCGAFVAVRLREATPPANPVHAAAATTAYSGSVTSFAVTKPAGVVNGSTCMVFLLLEHSTASAPTSITPPSSERYLDAVQQRGRRQRHRHDPPGRV